MASNGPSQHDALGLARMSIANGARGGGLIAARAAAQDILQQVPKARKSQQQSVSMRVSGLQQNGALPSGSVSLMSAEDEFRLRIENFDLRRLLVQAGLDAAEHKGLEQLQRVLVEELHHRVKNTLATVMAITSQSLRSAADLEQGRVAIADRLIALGRVHDLLLKTNWSDTPLAVILRSAIEPFDTAATSRFFVQSANVDVSAAAVLPLAMVLNELCSNAVKYGALSNTGGRVDIAATVEESGSQVRLKWTESGGPRVREPTGRGFGSRLIEHSFVSQSQGQAALVFDPNGVICLLDIPVTHSGPPGWNSPVV